MNKRPMIGLSRRDLVSLIAKGDPAAIAEGKARNASRARKGKTPVKAYDAAPAPAPVPEPAPAPAAPAPAAPAAEAMIATIVAEAVAAALAARGLSPSPAAPAAPAPAPDADDAAIWSQCLADANGSRWEAYDRMESIIGKRKRSRIAKAAGVSAQSVSNALSKYRRGIAPDLSFAGK